MQCALVRGAVARLTASQRGSVVVLCLCVAPLALVKDAEIVEHVVLRVSDGRRRSLVPADSVEIQAFCLVEAALVPAKRGKVLLREERVGIVVAKELPLSGEQFFLELGLGATGVAAGECVADCDKVFELATHCVAIVANLFQRHVVGRKNVNEVTVDGFVLEMKIGNARYVGQPDYWTAGIDDILGINRSPRGTKVFICRSIRTFRAFKCSSAVKQNVCSLSAVASQCAVRMRINLGIDSLLCSIRSKYG